MSAYRFPVVISKLGEQLCTGWLLEDGTCAVDTTQERVLDQLERYVALLYQEEPHRGEPFFTKPSFHRIPVRLNPEYGSATRRFRSGLSLQVPIPVVTGETPSGGPLLYLPTLGVSVGLSSVESLEESVRQEVHSVLRGKPPELFFPFLRASQWSLDKVSFKPRTSSVKVPVQYPPLLTQLADPLFGAAFRQRRPRGFERRELIRCLQSELSGSAQNLLLVGPSGVGKTEVLYCALLEFQRSQVRGQRGDDADSDEIQPLRTFWRSTAARLNAGTRYLGEWQGRLESLMEVLTNANGTLVLERLLDVLEEGGPPAEGMGAFLIPAMKEKRVRIIAEATPEEVAAIRRQLPALLESFTSFVVDPLPKDGAELELLKKVFELHAQNHGLEVEEQTLGLVKLLHERFLPYVPFPGRVLVFLQGLVESLKQQKSKQLTDVQVYQHFQQVTGIPERLLREDLPLPREEVEAFLTARVVGQEQAVERVTRLVLMFKTSLADSKRPLGVLLFAGPTGVGKTELARSLAELLFGAGEGGAASRLIRLDMSEYADPMGGERLVRGPEGGPSLLVQRLRQQPFSVVLLDEIEKAHPQVFDVLMSAFDEGRLTDRSGRVTWLRSSIIILTSNLGTTQSVRSGFGQGSTTNPLTEALRFFRPEFVNRLDQWVSFQPLGPEQVGRIAALELGRLNQREGLQRLKIQLRWDNAVVERLARVGFDARYGARPLQRAVEREVVVPLSYYLAAHPTLHDCILGLRVEADAVRVDVWEG
ncbi:MAG: AAA family ATPase [Myxococcota bacterium]